MSELKVQFGCGGNKLDGWQNHDSEVDITKRLPYEDNSVDAILLEHVWEHIDPHSALRCLDECRRILKSGGLLRLCVPVLDRLSADHGRDIVFGHGHLGVYTRDSVYHMMRLAGFQNISEASHAECDNHWRVIGREKDELETCRMIASK